MRTISLLALLMIFIATDLFAQAGGLGGTGIPIRKFPTKSLEIGAHWNGEGLWGLSVFLTPETKPDKLSLMSKEDVAIQALSAPELSYQRVYLRLKDPEKALHGISNGGAVFNCFIYNTHFAFPALTLTSSSLSWSIFTPSLGWGLYQMVFDDTKEFDKLGTTMTELADENKDLNFGYSVGISTDFLWKEKLRVSIGGELQTVFKSVSALYLPVPILGDVVGKRPRTRFVTLFVKVGLQN